ncbi:MAG: PVC-type heme-binding CxxCH protein [Planctomycetaceae bacterium]
MLHQFRRVQLTDTYFSEGASFGDINNDGVMDVVCGPYWFAGPDFKTKSEIYSAQPQDRNKYADNFFSWVRDFDGDGWNDMLAVGFPGTPAYVYENPGRDKHDATWPKHTVADWVSNESPQFVNLVGDDTPELVCTRDGRFGYLTVPRAADRQARATRQKGTGSLHATTIRSTSNSQQQGACPLLSDCSPPSESQRLETAWLPNVVYSGSGGKGTGTGQHLFASTRNLGGVRSQSPFLSEPMNNDDAGTSRAFGRWDFHPISEDIAPKRFGHALGVGDVNNDGRADVLFKDGWFEQPEDVAGDPQWKLHQAKFCEPGGADMFAYDVDGDGDNDVITSLGAHDYGLAWHEQLPGGKFKQHTIMGRKPSENKYGVLFTEPHAMKLVDIDGDGLKDIVTGKTYWSHHKQSPMWDAGAVVYWFKLVREEAEPTKTVNAIVRRRYAELQKPRKGEKATTIADMRAALLADKQASAKFRNEMKRNGLTLNMKLPPAKVDWLPYKADGEAGIGRGLSVGDSNGDQLPDIVVGGMKGAHVLIHERREVSDAEWHAAQPVEHKELASGLSPEEAAKNMTVPPGFKVQLAAGEPMVHQPIAFTFDDRGRLWLAEAYTYPTRAKDGEGKDKIVILEDTDLDGDFDKRTVFIEGLNLVSGLEVGFGGVWVGAAPYLMFIPDRDGDDKPDKPIGELNFDLSKADLSAARNRFNEADRRRIEEDFNLWKAGIRRPGEPQFPKDVPPGAIVLLDGFGWHDTHEVLNSFIWGPDGWLYGCHGIFTHSKVGKPGTADDKRTKLNAGVWRYHPQRHEFEVFAEGTSNPWGVDFNEKGDAFITACVIPHLYHVIPGARYQRQAGQHFNPHTYDDIKTIADHLHYTGNIKDHAWWGHEPDVPKGTDDAGGGHAHCGAMIYLGDNWPKEYRGKLFFNNIHGNRINTDILEPKGSGYVGRHGKDFLKANDRWFRGINMKYAPDGTVYLIDWYDKNACHRTNPEIWDRTNGRIYRIVYGDKKPERVNLGAMSSSDLIKLHTHENEWLVRTARRLLQERGLSTNEFALVQRMMNACVRETPAGGDPQAEKEWDALARTVVIAGAAHQLGWTPPKSKHRFGRWISTAWRIHNMKPDKGSVKAFAMFANRWLDELGPTDKAAETERARKRLAVAAALQNVSPAERWDVAFKLLDHAEDATDHNLPLMYWYAIEPLVPADTARAMKLAEQSKIPLITRYIYRRAASEDKLINHVVDVLAKTNNNARRELVLDEMSRAFEGRVNIPMPPAWKPAYDALAKSDKAAVRDKADRIAILLGDARIFPRMRARLVDENEPIEKRREALDILVRGRDAGAADSWLTVLNEPQLRGPAIRALAAIDDARTAPALIGQYGSMPEPERRDAVSTLVARKGSALALLDAIEAKKIPSTDLHAYHIRELDRFKDDKLNARIKSVWGDIRESSADKKKQILDTKAMLLLKNTTAPDLGNGRRLFDKTCASCHMLFGSGGKVGPDITGSNRANLDYILENVIDPSAVMGRDYRMSTFLLDDGRSVSGLVQKETDSALTVRTINDTIVVAKDDIDDQTQSELSLMPERLLDSLKENEVRDLIAYLASPAQVASKGPRSPIDAKTNRVPGAIEGETMRIVKVTRGRATGQPMAQFKGDRWSNNDHMWWINGELGDTLTLEFPVKETGTYDMEIVMTRAVDYGMFQLLLDGKEIGSPVDLYDKEVITTGVLTIPVGQVESGTHELTAKIIGANPKAIKRYMFGLDYIRLKQIAK